MNPTRLDDAVGALRESMSRHASVRSLVLFGSVARGTATDESDIDVLVDCEEAAKDSMRKIIHDVESRFDVSISPTFYRAEERPDFDTQFLESILRHGVPLIGELPALTPQDLDLQPLRLVSYQIDRISPKKRARLLRTLDGYKTEKKVRRKRYQARKRGFLDEVGGWRAGRGAVVVPEEAAERLDTILKQFGATRTMIPIWCQRP